MRLRDWMYDNNVDQGELAKKLDLSRVFVCKILNGKAKAGPKTARRIQTLTNGKVSGNAVLNQSAIGQSNRLYVDPKTLCPGCRKRFLQKKN